MISNSTIIPHYRQPQGQAAAGMTGQLPLFPPSPAIGGQLPTGMPLGPSYSGVPGSPAIPSGSAAQPATTGLPPQSVQDSYYTAGFLRTQIGKRMRLEFLIGTNGALVDRTGTLVGVGASYVLLRPDGTNITVMADLYSIKFVTIYVEGEPMI